LIDVIDRWRPARTPFQPPDLINGDWHLDLTPPKDVVATRLYPAPGALFPTAPV